MNGILVIDKPINYTSRDIVNIVSKKLNTKKIGHTGTLDPLATGVLVLTIGNCTKISELLTSTYKEYIAEIKLGIKTDTLDITGNILEKKEVNLNKDDLEKTLKSFHKTYMQEVPIYSAVKVDGKKLYEYARSGKEVTLPKKEVEIKNIELLSYEEDIVKIKCLVSKGTYIRSLIKDICDSLNIIGTMSNLRRIKQGDFDIKNSYTLDDIENNNYKLISIEEVLNNYLTVDIDDYLYNRIKNGSILENRYNEDIIVFKYKNNVVAIYKVYDKDSTKIKPYKML